jgi:hypothetical protein
MKNKILLSLFTAALLFLAACHDDVLKSDYDHIPDPALLPKSLVTLSVNDVGSVDVVVSGSVLKKTNLLDWGVIYYTPEMLLNDEYKIVSGKNDLSGDKFDVKVRGLIPMTDYLCKTYALNENGIVYGNELSFKTNAPQGLPWSLNVSDPESVWSATSFDFIDADGDGNQWQLAYFDEAKTEIGLMSYSWYEKALTPENYVFMPPLLLGASKATLEIDVQGFDPKFYAEKYKVIISETPLSNIPNARDAKVLLEEVLTTDVRTTKKIDIPLEYKNKMVWIGICHFDSSDQFAIGITNIKVY